MRRAVLALLAALALCLMVAGCAGWKNPIPALLVTKGTAEKQLVTLRTEYEGKIAAARATQEQEARATLAAKDAQMQGAATALYGSDQVFRSIIQPTRTDLITHNLALEAWSALGNRPPTAEAMRAMNERLTKELDSARTSLADLAANHAAALAQNAALAEQAKRHEAALAAAREQVAAAERERDAKIAAKQTELLAIQDKLIAAEKARADDRAAIQALKTKASTILGLVGLAAIAIAIYVPVFRGSCATFGAVCVLGAAAIWVIPSWVVAVAAAVCILGLIGWMVYTHQRKDRSHDALALTVQDLRDKGGDIAKAVEHTLADRTARYRRAKDGSLVTERDPTVEREIQTTLAAYDALPVAAPAPVSTPPIP